MPSALPTPPAPPPAKSEKAEVSSFLDSDTEDETDDGAIKPAAVVLPPPPEETVTPGKAEVASFLDLGGDGEADDGAINLAAPAVLSSAPPAPTLKSICKNCGEVAPSIAQRRTSDEQAAIKGFLDGDDSEEEDEPIPLPQPVGLPSAPKRAIVGLGDKRSTNMAVAAAVKATKAAAAAAAAAKEKEAGGDCKIITQFNAAAGQELFMNLFRTRGAQPPPSVPPLLPTSGFMSKLSRKGQWQERWFAFRLPGMMVYWKRRPEDPDLVSPDAIIDLRRVRRLTTTKEGAFVLKFSSRNYSVKATGGRPQLKRWTDAVKHAMKEARESKRRGSTSGGGSGIGVVISGPLAGAGADGGIRSSIVITKADSSDDEEREIDRLTSSERTRALAQAQESAKRKLLNGQMPPEEYASICDRHAQAVKGGKKQKPKPKKSRRSSSPPPSTSSKASIVPNSAAPAAAAATAAVPAPQRTSSISNIDAALKSVTAKSAPFGLFRRVASLHGQDAASRTTEEQKVAAPEETPSLGTSLAVAQASAKSKLERGIITPTEYREIVKMNRKLFKATAEKGDKMPSMGVVFGGEEAGRTETAIYNAPKEEEKKRFLRGDSADDEASVGAFIPIVRTGPKSAKDKAALASFLDSDNDDDDDDDVSAKVTPPPASPMKPKPTDKADVASFLDSDGEGEDDNGGFTPAPKPAFRARVNTGKVAISSSFDDDDDAEENDDCGFAAAPILPPSAPPAKPPGMTAAVSSFLDSDGDDDDDDGGFAAAPKSPPSAPPAKPPGNKAIMAPPVIPKKAVGGRKPGRPMGARHSIGEVGAAVNSDIDDESSSSSEDDDDDDDAADDFLAGGGNDDKEEALSTIFNGGLDGDRGGSGGGGGPGTAIRRAASSGSGLHAIPDEFADRARVYRALSTVSGLRFTLLPLEARRAMVRSVVLRRFESAAEAIVTQGDADNSSFFIVTGPSDDSEVAITVRREGAGGSPEERDITHLGFGAYFGERPLINPPGSRNFAPRSATVRPAAHCGPVECAEVPVEAFKHWQPFRLSLILGDVPLLQKLPKVRQKGTVFLAHFSCGLGPRAECPSPHLSLAQSSYSCSRAVRLPALGLPGAAAGEAGVRALRAWGVRVPAGGRGRQVLHGHPRGGSDHRRRAWPPANASAHPRDAGRRPLLRRGVPPL